MYQDRWISAGDDGIRVRGYYFPWGSKHIAYDKIAGIRRVTMTYTRGRGRIWGTASPTLWASLDPQRLSKSIAFVLDLGHTVRPFLTPDDPAAFLAEVRTHARDVTVTEDSGKSPIV